MTPTDYEAFRKMVSEVRPLVVLEITRADDTMKGTLGAIDHHGFRLHNGPTDHRGQYVAGADVVSFKLDAGVAAQGVTAADAPVTPVVISVPIEAKRQRKRTKPA